MSLRQATNRGYQIMLQELGKAGARPGDEKAFAATAHEDLPARLIDVLSKLPGSPETYAKYASDWESSNETNSANNHFNHQLAAYAKSAARLERYRLVEGRDEVTELVQTGELDDFGQPISEAVVVARAIAPLPAQIESPVFNEAGVQTGSEMIDNPEVVVDERERAEAAYMISTLPQEVKDFHAQLNAAE